MEGGGEGGGRGARDHTYVCDRIHFSHIQVQARSINACKLDML